MERDILWRQRVICPKLSYRIVSIRECKDKKCPYYDGDKYGGLYGKIICKWRK